MRNLDILGIAFSALKDRRLRSALTIIGMAVGPATLVALIGMTQGFSATLTDQFGQFGVDTIVVIPSRAGAKLTLQDVSKIETVEHVADTIPFYRTVATLKSGGTSMSMQVMALDLSALPILLPGLEVAEGAVPSNLDLTAVVIGYNLAQPPDPEQQPISVNQILSLETTARFFRENVAITRSYLVEASLEKFGAGLLIDVDNGVFISFEAGKTLTRAESLSGVFVKVDNLENALRVVEDLNDKLGEDITVISIDQILSQIQTILGGVTAFMTAIALMSVAVAFIGIMTTMFTSVTERTREIGLLKALGYNRRNIMMIFIYEAGITGLIGGIVGAAAGGIMAYIAVPIIMGSFTPDEPPPGGFQQGGGVFQGDGGSPPGAFELTPLITPELILGAVVMALLVGVLAGLLPAWRASRLTPVDALRHE
ncbi:MAG: ABC transporter permease [Nitrososphaerales archaeon]